MKKILLIDFGSVLTLKIEDVLRRNNFVYEKVKHDFDCDDLNNYKGIILSGSPDHVYDNGRICREKFIKNNLPKLGICYGHQLCNYVFKGKVDKAEVAENDVSKLFTIKNDNPIFKGMKESHNVAMYHFDEVSKLGEGFICLGSTDVCKNAASYNEEYNIYSLQFHPEDDKYSDYVDEYYINFNDICEKKNGD